MTPLPADDTLVSLLVYMPRSLKIAVRVNALHAGVSASEYIRALIQQNIDDLIRIEEWERR